MQNKNNKILYFNQLNFFDFTKKTGNQMILFDENDLSPTRKRTLNRLVAAALRMYEKNRFPSPDEITQEAEYSKITLYNYFQTQNDFIEYLVKQLVGSISAPSLNGDTEQNLDDLFRWGFEILDKNEALMRDAIRTEQSRWQDEKQSERYMLRKSNRRESLAKAIAPLKDKISDAKMERLIRALSLLFGTESIIVFKDMYGMNKEEIIEMTLWMAKSILKETLKEN